MMEKETELAFNRRLVRLIAAYWAERGRAVDIDVVPAGRPGSQSYMLYNREPWPGGMPPRRLGDVV